MAITFYSIARPKEKVTVPIKNTALSKTAAPALEETKQLIRELLFEDVNYSQVIIEINKLPKERQGDPELLVYLAIAHRFTGNREKFNYYQALFLQWYNINPAFPKAILLQATFFHRLGKNKQALVLLQEAENNSAVWAEFSNTEKKELFLLAGICLCILPELNEKLAMENLTRAKIYLESALGLNGGDNPKVCFLDYRSYMFLAEAHKGLAIFSAEPQADINSAFAALKSAQRLRPQSKRVCLEWQDLSRQNPTPPPLPDTCR